MKKLRRIELKLNLTEKQKHYANYSILASNLIFNSALKERMKAYYNCMGPLEKLKTSTFTDEKTLRNQVLKNFKYVDESLITYAVGEAHENFCKFIDNAIDNNEDLDLPEYRKDIKNSYYSSNKKANPRFPKEKNKVYIANIGQVDSDKKDIEINDLYKTTVYEKDGAYYSKLLYFSKK